jgi:hypothetical protein
MGAKRYSAPNSGQECFKGSPLFPCLQKSDEGRPSLEIKQVHFNANCPECREDSMRYFSRKSASLLRKVLQIYIGLTSRNTLGGGVHEPEQSEFPVGFYRSAVIFHTFNLASFLIDLLDQGRSAIVTLQDRCEGLECHPVFGRNDSRLGDREFQSREYPAVGG